MFKGFQSMTKIVEKIDANISYDLNEDKELASSFYKFKLAYFHDIFLRNDYGTKLVVIDNTEEMNLHEDKEVIIVVNETTPTSGSQILQQNNFNLDVICILRAEEKGKTPQIYDAVRYMKHPGFECYWKQEKTDYVVTKCISGDIFFRNLQDSKTEDSCFMPVFLSM